MYGPPCAGLFSCPQEKTSRQVRSQSAQEAGQAHPTARLRSSDGVSGIVAASLLSQGLEGRHHPGSPFTPASPGNDCRRRNQGAGDFPTLEKPEWYGRIAPPRRPLPAPSADGPHLGWPHKGSGPPWLCRGKSLAVTAGIPALGRGWPTGRATK